MNRINDEMSQNDFESSGVDIYSKVDDDSAFPDSDSNSDLHKEHLDEAFENKEETLNKN